MAALGYIKRTTGPKTGTPDEMPTWHSRSTLSPDIGFWRQRNGNVVQITKKLALQCQGPRGKAIFPCWFGHCTCCKTPCTWNINGTYAAVGTHAFDIIEAFTPEIVK